MRLALLFAALLTAPAAGQTPATPADQYEAARGAPLGERSAWIWEVSVETAQAEAPEKSRITLTLGEDWAHWSRDDESAQFVDLEAARLITMQEGGPGSDATGFVSTSLYAEARRRVDIYAALSERGTQDRIAFGEAGEFHRIWLEAAMGVAAQDGALQIEAGETVLSAAHYGETITRLSFAPGEDSACQSEPVARTRAMLAFLRHAAALHPDIITALAERGVTPCALQFTVISPDSPDGRTERWTLFPDTGARPDAVAQGAPAPPQGELVGAVGQAALAAARGEFGAAPDAAAFYEAMMARRAQGDLAGALLVSVQETHHFGPCPQQAVGSARLACAEISALTRAGLGDSDFERALEGVTAMREGEHAVAVDRLSAFLTLDGKAGAAARILTANELVAWGRDGLQSRPDLDPAALLGEALQLDPYAPDVYWHIGRRYLEAGAPHAAWLFFDVGRALPGRETTPLLRQAEALESRLAALAPHWAPAPGLDPARLVNE